MLDDPLVEEYVARAQDENLDLVQAVTRLRAARAGLRQARAARVPTISANSGASRDFGDFAGNDVLFSLGADASWEVDLFGRIDASVEAARGDLQAAGYSLGDLERCDRGAGGQPGGLTARSIAAQLAIARDTLANQEDNLQIARWRNQAGLVATLDVEQARTQRAQTAAAIPQLESNLAAVANAISTLIGEPPGRVYRALAETPRGVPVPPAEVELTAPADMLRRRPDVSAAEARLAADLDRVGVARAQLYPLVRLSGSVGTNATDLEKSVRHRDRQCLCRPEPADFRRRACTRTESRARRPSPMVRWRRGGQTILAALEDVETSAVDLRTSGTRVEALIEANDGAQNAALLARSQYQAGLIDFQTLLVAESQLLSTRTAQVNAEASRALAFVSLARALGGGWAVPDGAGLEELAARGLPE